MEERYRDILEALSYEPVSGVFTWTRGNSKNIRAGDIAGSVRKGKFNNRNIHYKHRIYKAGRLTFLFMDGSIPPDDMEVVHIDGDRSNDSFLNLKLISRTNPIHNLNQNRAVRSDNTSGTVGVNYNIRKKKFTAEIMAGKKRVWLGTFETKKEAIEVRKAAEEKYHGS